MATNHKGTGHERPVTVHSDSLDGEFYYNKKEHALYPVSAAHQRKNFEEYYRIDPDSRQVIGIPRAYTHEENRLMWEQLHPSTPHPYRMSGDPSELDEFNRRSRQNVSNPFPPARVPNPQPGPSRSGGSSSSSGDGAGGMVRVVPGPVLASAR